MTARKEKPIRDRKPVSSKRKKASKRGHAPDTFSGPAEPDSRFSTNSSRPKPLGTPSTLLIIIAPTGRTGSFSATIGTSTLVKNSRQPHCDAARVLHRRGHPDDTLLISKREGSDHESMRGPLGLWRKLRVREDKDGPRFAKYESFATARVGEKAAKHNGTLERCSKAGLSRPERHRAPRRR